MSSITIDRNEHTPRTARVKVLLIGDFGMPRDPRSFLVYMLVPGSRCENTRPVQTSGAYQTYFQIRTSQSTPTYNSYASRSEKGVLSNSSNLVRDYDTSGTAESAYVKEMDIEE